MEKEIEISNKRKQVLVFKDGSNHEDMMEECTRLMVDNYNNRVLDGGDLDVLVKKNNLVKDISDNVMKHWMVKKYNEKHVLRFNTKMEKLLK